MSLALKTLPRNAVSGFSLIELIIAITVFGILISMGLPAFSRLIADVRLRNQAEYVFSGLQLAKGEALKRNATVRFQLVSTLDNGCVVVGPLEGVTNSNFWLVSHGDPTAKCGLVESILNTDTTANDPYGAPPVLLIKGSREQQTTAQTRISVLVNGLDADPIACFNGTGRLNRVLIASGLCTPSMNPAITAAPTVTIDITDPATQDANSAVTGQGLCFSDDAAAPAGFHANGTVRCQRILISPAGEIRMCDPGLSAAKHPNDPRVCS